MWICLYYIIRIIGAIMKFILPILVISLSFLYAKDNTTYIKVDGMQCSYSCAGKVNSVVQNMKGVKESTVDFAKGVATVTYDEKKTNSSKIVEGLKKNTSYTVQLVNATTSSSYNSNSSCGGSKKDKKSAI